MAVITRDYGLDGPETQHAIEVGLADGDWYQSPIDPALLRELSERSDARAAADIALWLILLVGSGVIAVVTWGSWVSILALLVYWPMFGGASDPRWHECGHGTAFKTQWMNTLFYYPASFMLFRGPSYWKWSHVRHHSDTIVVGRDPELVFPRPSSIAWWVLDLTHLVSGPKQLSQFARHARGALDAGERGFLPEAAQRAVVREARVALALHAGTVIWALATWSLMPVAFFFGPTFLGSWLLKFFGTTQHAGLREDVLDHRRNTRTVMMNPVFRFLYLNMNYHIEHHMFPTVPYRNLPRLHEAIKDDLPTPHPNTLSAYRELFGAMKHQAADTTWEIEDLRLPKQASVSTTAAQRTEPLAVVAEPMTEGWVEVDAPDAIDGTIVRVDVGDATYAAYRTAGAWRVTDGICTHSRTIHLATGVIVGTEIECPKHNGRFDIETGEPTREPVCVALATYPAEATADGLRFRI